MKLIRDILKDKSASAQSARTGDSIAKPRIARTSAPLTDDVETSDNMFLEPKLAQLDVSHDEQSRDQDMVEELAALEAAAGGSDLDRAWVSPGAQAKASEDEFEYDNEDVDYDDEIEKLDAFDQAAFMKTLKAAESEDENSLPDPFAKLSNTATNPSDARRASPSPLKSKPAPSPSKNALDIAAQAPTEEAEGPDSDIGSLADLTPLVDASDLAPIDIPAPAAGRASGRSGRVKTRLLGFSGGVAEHDDPFSKETGGSSGKFPVGWVAVVSEMGRGSAFPLYDGVSRVGRGTDQSVSLNFGDNSISRENHVSIAYDAEQNKFFIGHSGKSNLVRINDKPLLSTEELHTKDLIRLGETTLRFMAFCEDDFNWNGSDDADKSNV